MITELTPEQEAQLEVYAEKWAKIALSTEPANRPEAERGVNLAYELAGLKPPKEIIWFESPMSMCQYRMHMNEKPLCDRVAHDIMRSVQQTVKNTVSQTIESQIFSSCTHIVDIYRPFTQIFVKNEIRDSLPFAVLTQAIRQQLDIYWLTPIDYYRNVLDLITETEKLSGLLIISQNAGWWSPSKDICLIAERPNHIQCDTSNKFHCENGFAISYPDGWGTYVWHYIHVPEYVILRPHDITPDKIMTEENAEISRVMIERYGQDNFIRDGGFSKVQSDDYGDLYRVEFENGDESIVAVHVQGASTDRDYFLYVPPHIRTAHEGVAWTFGYDNVTDYNPDRET